MSREFVDISIFLGIAARDLSLSARRGVRDDFRCRSAAWTGWHMVAARFDLPVLRRLRADGGEVLAIPGEQPRFGRLDVCER